MNYDWVERGQNVVKKLWFCQLKKLWQSLLECLSSIFPSLHCFRIKSSKFAARIKIDDIFKICMNRAFWICQNILQYAEKKLRNTCCLTRETFLLPHPLWSEKGGIFRSFPRVPKLPIWLLRGWWRCFKLTLQTCAAENFRSCRRGPTGGPPLAWPEILHGS